MKYNYLTEVVKGVKVSDFFAYNLSRRTNLFWDAAQITLKDKLFEQLESRLKELSQFYDDSSWVLADFSVCQDHQEGADERASMFDVLIQESQIGIINQVLTIILKNDATGNFSQCLLRYLSDLACIGVDIKPIVESHIAWFQVKAEYQNERVTNG